MIGKMSLKSDSQSPLKITKTNIDGRIKTANVEELCS